MTFITSVQVDVLYQENGLNLAFSQSSPTVQRLKGISSTLVDLSGPAGRPAPPSIQTNNRHPIINQKLQTDFVVS